MSKFGDIKELLSNTFDNFPDVLEIEVRSEFSIIDYQGQSFIIININSDDDTFTIKLNGVDTVENGFDITKLFNVINAKMVGFIPIDGKKGLLGFGDSHCDFVFFDENDFCFVEFKLNATSLRKVDANRDKAIKQLTNTIDLFDKKLNGNYADLNLEAYVCTPEFYPRFNSSWIAFAKDFLEEYGFELFEINNKICD
ncbi:MAG: hypothetical protein HEQ20_11085 [Aphanizomenon flos-aquae KM1D3_PB]|jgi:hypothetical protein|uniref:hypothetical protein n=2 Tax=Cyanophyceae TaxID=3028117 RepID=UPI0005444246|nr:MULTISPECIES: hypothetical protein [Nostocales]ALB40837.1 hypothetical protein AA650_10450 [Anabaena sp. WA102]KHG41124.1 hypothetical protein OA07_13430 [Aphanizomenon flos-aquae 2012/KM1/D3]QSV71206.1 MAG: hypothetical protein HEQ20_11085 [Aphanizomenon flos-aquae KM1D3_PB]